MMQTIVFKAATLYPSTQWVETGLTVFLFQGDTPPVAPMEPTRETIQFERNECKLCGTVCVTQHEWQSKPNLHFILQNSKQRKY